MVSAFVMTISPTSAFTHIGRWVLHRPRKDRVRSAPSFS